MGVSLEHRDSFEEASQVYKKAIDLSKSNKVALMHLLRFDKRKISRQNVYFQ